MIGYTYYESDSRVIREAEAAVDSGFEVDFVALRRAGSPRAETIRGVRVVRLAQEKYRGRGHLKYFLAYFEFFIRCFLKTTALFFQKGYRVIHVNNMPDFLVFTTLIPRLFGTKIILDIHDPMPNTFASKFKGQESGFFYRLLLWQEKLSAAYSSQVVTVHHPVRDGILVKHGFRPEDIEVIANFADSALFPLRHNFSVDGKVRFVFHGTILERSGLRLLMTALSGMRCKDGISVKIIGEGDFSPTLRDLIQSLSLERTVEFDNRSYPAHSVSEQMTDCNAGLVPLEISSVTDYALPLKLVEYMSMGLPVVTVRSKAISYYFGEQDCLFFDSNDPKSLSDLLDRIAQNPKILLCYRERSLALRDRFSWNGEKAKYGALLHRLAGTQAVQQEAV
jgi:glycosyltransferase involved in cell wall biosynthesis